MTQDIHAALPSHSPNAPHSFAPGDSDAISVPYAGQTSMQLTIASGKADARIRIDPNATELMTIHGADGAMPRVRVSAGELRVSWPMTFGSWLSAAFTGAFRDIEIVLHPAVEWALQMSGGLARFEADLTAGKIARIAVSGGISNARFDLPAPTATVPVRVSGGVNQLTLSRPVGARVSLAIGGGVAALHLDDQMFGAVGGGLRLNSGVVRGDTPRYAVEVSGGACGLWVTAH
jgi:hypothetical protein